MMPIRNGSGATGRLRLIRLRSRAALLGTVTSLLFLCFPSGGNPAETLQAPSAIPAETHNQAPTGSAPVRDPFLPGDGGVGSLYPPSVDPGQLELQAILFHPGDSKALISGQVVGEGDRLFDYTVSTIQPGRVSLQRGKNQYVLFLLLSHEKR
jgi:hypothetical protein